MWSIKGGAFDGVCLTLLSSVPLGARPRGAVGCKSRLIIVTSNFKAPPLTRQTSWLLDISLRTYLFQICARSVWTLMLAGRSSCSTRRVLFFPAHFCYTAKTNWSLQMADKAIGHKSPATLLSHLSLSLFSPKGDQQERRTHWPKKKKANKLPPASHPCKEKNTHTHIQKTIRHNWHTSWQLAAFCHF